MMRATNWQARQAGNLDSTTKTLGKVKTSILLTNPAEPGLQRIEADSLANTGINYLCIPAHVAQQLKLKTLEKRTIVRADGSLLRCDYVGPVQIDCLHRTCLAGALVLGDEVLLGDIPLRDMNLCIHPSRKKLVVSLG